MADLIGTAFIEVEARVDNVGRQISQDIERQGNAVSDAGEAIGRQLEEGVSRSWRSALNNLGDDVSRFTSNFREQFQSIDEDIRKNAAEMRNFSRTTRRAGLAGVGLIGLVGAMNNITAATTGAVAAVGLMSQSLLVLPAAGAAGAAAIGTLVVGMQGFGEALSNMDDPEKFNEALADLAPNARATAIAMRDMNEQFRDVRLDVQNALFNDMAEVINQLGSTYLPVLREGMVGVANAFNESSTHLTHFLTQGQTVADVATIFENTRRSIDPLMVGLQNLAQVFRDVAAVGSSFLPGIAQGFAGATNRLAEFIARARETGQLRVWIQEGIDAVQQFGRILANIGSIFSSVFSAMNVSGAGFLNTLEDLTGELADFLDSAEGRQALESLGQVLATVGRVASDIFGAAIEQLAPVITALTPAVTQLAVQFGQFLVAALNRLGPILVDIANFLSQNMDWLGPIIIAVGTLTTVLGPLASAFLFLRNAIQIALVAFRVLRVAFLTNPFTALAAAVAAIAYLIISNWENISQWLRNVWNNITRWASNFGNGIARIFNNVLNAIRNTWTRVWNAITGFISRVWNGIVRIFNNAIIGIGRAINWFASLPQRFGQWLSSVARSVGRWLGNVVDFFRRLPGNIVRAIGNVGHTLFNIGRNMIQGLINGVGRMAQALWNAIRNVVARAWNGLLDFLGIRSPSREGIWAGQQLGQGLINGLESMQGVVDQAATQLAASALNGLSTVDGATVQANLAGTAQGNRLDAMTRGGRAATRPGSTYNIYVQAGMIQDQRGIQDILTKQIDNLQRQGRLR